MKIFIFQLMWCNNYGANWGGKIRAVSALELCGELGVPALVEWTWMFMARGCQLAAALSSQENTQ